MVESASFEPSVYILKCIGYFILIVYLTEGIVDGVREVFLQLEGWFYPRRKTW